MKEVRNAIADRLLALSSITTQLGTFKGFPAVFNGSPIPPSAEGRYIVIREAFSDEEFGSKTPDNPPADLIVTRGRIVSHDIGIYEDQTGDTSTLEELATVVRDAFNRYPLTVSGYGTLIARATGPIQAPSSEAIEQEVSGQIVTVELTVIKNP